MIPARFGLLLAVMLGFGCNPALRQPVVYEGLRGSSQETPRVVDRLPRGYELLGRAHSRCDYVRDPARFDDEWLSNVDCSARRLRGAIAREAMRAGAELIVGMRCASRFRGDDQRLALVRCEAAFARSSHELRQQSALGAALPTFAGDASDWDEAPEDAAWRIKVSYVPQRPARRSGPRSAALVSELSVMPPSHHPVGTITARCDVGCERAAVRSALRVAAARLGLDAVVGTRCVPQRAGWRCTGELAQPEEAPRG